MSGPYYADDAVTLHHGDCLDVMASLPDGSVDAVVTDPPYGLEFMGKDWDGADGFRRSLNPADAGRESVFGRTSRTSPEYRTGSVFQQWSQEWATECLRVLKPGGYLLAFGGTRTWHRLACAIEDAGFQLRDSIAWLHGQGFPKGKGQLKPAFEPVIVAKKAGPIWLNVDGCRVDANGERFGGGAHGSSGFVDGYERGSGFVTSTAGRWPTNVLLDGDAADELDRQSGTTTSRVGNPRGAAAGDGWGMTATGAEYDDQGGSSRFFPTFRYEAKADSAERPRVEGVAHPTVKPLDLMRWLVRLVTPPPSVWCENRCHETKAPGRASRLSDVREDAQTEGQQSEATVLLQGLRERSNAKDGAAEDLPDLFSDVHTDEDGPASRDVLLTGMQLESERTGEAKGAAPLGRRVRDRVPAPASDGDADGIHPAAPASDGGAPGTAADLGRSSAPPQRHQDGQPAGEPRGTAETDARPDPEATTEADRLPPLRGLDRRVGTCASCGAALVESGGIVLDPFAGSGTTAEAAVIEGFRCIAVEREAAYLPLIVARLTKPIQPDLFGGAA